MIIACEVLPPINFCCYLPPGKPEVKGVLCAVQQVSLQDHWA